MSQVLEWPCEKLWKLAQNYVRLLNSSSCQRLTQNNSDHHTEQGLKTSLFSRHRTEEAHVGQRILGGSIGFGSRLCCHPCPPLRPNTPPSRVLSLSPVLPSLWPPQPQKASLSSGGNESCLVLLGVISPMSYADWCWCHHRHSIFTTGGKVFYSTHKTTVVGAVHFHQHCPGLGLGHMRLIPDRNIGICIWDLLKSTTAYHFICPEVL